MPALENTFQMSVLVKRSPSKMLGKRLNQSVDAKSTSTFKSLEVDSTRNFPQNCGAFVRENNRSRVQQHADVKICPEFPSTTTTTKRVKVDAIRNFPERCGPCIPQEKNGSDTQCSANTNVIESVEPSSVSMRSNFEAKYMQPGQVKKDDLVATGARPEEAGDSSRLNTSCQPTNGNQPLKMKEKNLIYDESTQQHDVLVNEVLQKPSTDTGYTCDWFIKGEPVENGLELPAIVSQESLIERRNEPRNVTNKVIIEDAVNFMPMPEDIRSEQHNELNKGQDLVYKNWGQYESALMKKQTDLGVSQEYLTNSGFMSGVSGHGLLTEYEHIQKVKEVRKTRKLFDDVYTKLLLEDKAEKHEGPSKRRIHTEAAMTLKNQNKWINCEWTFGHVPGVEIGAQFRFRAELVTIGLHHQFIKGINYVNINRKRVATSIVDSGRYENKSISSETIIYVGEGGNPKVSFNARVEDQKLQGGNLALKNSMDLGYPVRVICGRQRVNGEKSNVRYIYAGLYTVTKCWQERAPTGKYVFKFELKRNLGQPNLTRELVSRLPNLVKVSHFPENVNKETKSIMQLEFVVDYDVSQGKEKIPIPAVNTIDDERPPPFTYITNMRYPDWYYISKPQGCNCTSGCSDSEQCSCASRNGGEIPFNTRGSILRAKPLVYECGPSCKCPPSCKNRVSQHGPRYHLEVFKTESRGWGLRSRDYISCGSFICEYVGELLDEREAENRIDHDEYLFDVGNYDEEIPKRNVARNNNLKVESNYLQRKDEDGFTLDALRYGNVGRFINHSCSPNLYAQNVMYYHGDRRVPHIMFFTSKRIPPLEELTYHYNYHIDHVYDKNGNMKRKNCRCGSRKCEGRMY